MNKGNAILIAAILLLLSIGWWMAQPKGVAEKQSTPSETPPSEKLISLRSYFRCNTNPVGEIIDSLLYERQSGPIELSENEGISKSTFLERTSPIASIFVFINNQHQGFEESIIDYQVLEYYLYNDIMPISSVEIISDGKKLKYSEDESSEGGEIRAEENVSAYAIPECSIIPIEEADFSEETPSSLTKFFNRSKECTLEFKEIDREAASSRCAAMCPPTKTGDKLHDLRAELSCDLYGTIARDAKVETDYAVLEGYIIAAGALQGVGANLEIDGNELYVFKNGAIRRFRDGTTSLEAHLAKLKAETEQTYNSFKNSVENVDHAGGDTYIIGMQTAEQEILDFMDRQFSKLLADDADTAILRASFLVDFKALAGLYFPEDSVTKTPTDMELKYLVSNCAEWLIAHPEAEKIWCGSLRLTAGTTLSKGDLPRIQNVNVSLRSDEYSVMFAGSSNNLGSAYAKFENGILTVLKPVVAGAYAEISDNNVVVTLTNT